MAAHHQLNGAQKLLETCGEGKASQQVLVPGTTLHSVDSASKAVASTLQVLQTPPSAAPATAPLLPQASSSPVMVVTKMATAAAKQLQLTKATPGPVSPSATPGRTVVITVPRPAGPQPVTVAPRPLQTTASHLPANIQIPAGMMLVRSDSGQLMLVSQQALQQAQHRPQVTAGQAPRILSHQVPPAGGAKGNEKVTVIRMSAPPTFLPAPVQKTAVVKVVGVTPKAAVTQSTAAPTHDKQPRLQAPATETRKEPLAIFTPETLESVKKCKNFLVTLIKLASSDSRSANMANNVRGLVRKLLEGKLEAEEFTQQLYQELKSTPQPCLVPFLKKSLPAVRRLTADPQLFIQQASTTARSSTTPAPLTSAPDTGSHLKTTKQVIQPARRVILRTGPTALVHPRNNTIPKNIRVNPKPSILQLRPSIGPFSVKQSFTPDPFGSRSGFKTSSSSYKEDDDINDVAFMAGVNLREENAQFLTGTVGSVVQSCQDQPFLSTSALLTCLLHTGQPLGVSDVGPEVVAQISHATQEYLRGLLEKLSMIAEQRKAGLKEDQSYTKVSDVRSQLRFLEEVETLNKKRQDEAEREKLLRLARSRSHPEDPHHQLLKQRAKELQQIEEAQLQQREANMAALAAIGPRRKRPPEQTESQVSLLPRPEAPRVTRVMMRDLLVCMEQEQFLRHSLTHYKAML